MRIFSMLAAAFGSAFVPLLSRGQSFPGHPGGPPSLPRGQAPARGIIRDASTSLSRTHGYGKSPSRRDRRRIDGRANAYASTKFRPRGDHRADITEAG